MHVLILFGIIGKKFNIHCELVTSQTYWLSGSQLDIPNFQSSIIVFL